MTTPDPHRLHPEGAPGVWEPMARSFLGDANYEHAKEQEERAKQRREEYLESMTAWMRAKCMLLVVVALVAIATAPAVAIWAWRTAL